MDFSEKNIEDLIYENLNAVGIQLLYERGFEDLTNYEIFERQVELGSYGRLDLVGFNYFPLDNEIKIFRKVIKVGIIEIKKGEININTFIQASRYATGIKHYFGLKKINVDICIHLVGTSIDLNELYYLLSPQLTAHVMTLDLINGIRFTEYEDNRVLTNPNFNIRESVKKNISSFLKERISDKLKYYQHEKDELQAD